MCRWTDNLLLSVQTIFLLFTVLHCFIPAGSASNEFMPQTVGEACPGDVLTYTCTINGSGNTIWSGTAFNCEMKMNEIILRHSQFNMSGSSGNCNDGAIMAQSIRVINNTCFSSQLNVTVDLEMNNKTIECAHSSETIITIEEARISVATAPPANVRLSEVRPGELIFNWSTGANRLTKLNYTINSNCGTCPNMSNTTMVTCSGLDVSTTPAMCTFSVRRVACNTIGNPSPPVVVILRVPDAPNVNVIPQYSLKNDGQSLTRIIVHIEQNMTLFAITDTISGSITSYNIVYGRNVQNKTACMEDNCEYTVDLPSSICSTSSELDVDVTVAAANLLGFGQPTEPIIIECESQFAKVNYDPVNTNLFCTFLNKVDSSPKSCRVLYGTCGQETYTIQGNTIEGSPFMIIIKLNSSIIRSTNNCYTVMASNGTYEIIVNGSINLPMSEGSKAALSAIIIPVVLVALGVIITTTVIGVIILLWRRKQRGIINCM